MPALGAEMDWSLILLLALGGGFFLWRQSKNAETAKVATARLESDTRLYQHIKTGMREYNFREREQRFWEAKDGQLLFETAHLCAYHVDHFVETRNYNCRSNTMRRRGVDEDLVRRELKYMESAVRTLLGRSALDGSR
jgi:hypothetical protein